jgi:alcohol dehydrogenase
MFHAGQLPVDQLLTDTLHLEEINEGFDRLHKGEVARQVILF